MKNILRYIVLWAGILLCIPAWSRNKNIINYFASNNQIIGVPMLDEDNVFRFYPEPIFKNTIKTAKVNYFVTNDVITVTLEKRKDGEYWECTLRDFELGESIQRVEVMVEFRKYELDEILRQYQIEPIEGADDLQNYVLLRRGDDKMLVVKRMVQQRERLVKYIGEYKKLSSEIVVLTKESLKITKDLIQKLEKCQKQKKDSVSSAEKNLNEIKNIFNEIKKSLKNDTTNFKNRYDELLKLDTNKTKQNNPLNFNLTSNVVNKLTDPINDAIAFVKVFNKDSNSNSIVQNVKKLDSLAKVYDNLLETIFGIQSNINQSFGISHGSQSPEVISIPSLVRGDGDKEYLYKAYQESRYSSILDIRYKEGDKETVVFVYRNDKLSLQYLQAADPEEKLGIFRARLVPFPVFSKQGGDFQWQSAQVVYEIALNFGYGIIKGDHFTPRLFDMNRMGIGLAISNSTFGEDDKSRFLAVTLSYDINTYSTISFGLNVASSPSPYLGVGINARAFKDIFQASKKLFGNNK